jgi:hypothetical protein
MTTYTEAVTEARTLVKRSEDDQWRLAELTWEQVQAGKSRRQWAKDIGIHNSTAVRLYQIWERFGADPDQHSFAEAYDVVHGRAAAVEEHGSRYQAEAASAIRNMPPERKAQIVREAVKADPVAAAAASEALDERWAATAKPAPRDRSKADRLSETLLAARAVQRKVNEFANLASSTTWTVPEQEALVPLIDRIISVLDLAKAGVQSGSWDEELADLLNGGQS